MKSGKHLCKEEVQCQNLAAQVFTLSQDMTQCFGKRSAIN